MFSNLLPGHSEHSKGSQPHEPIQAKGYIRLCDLAKQKLKHGIFSVASDSFHHPKAEEPSSREITRWLLTILSPSCLPSPPKLSRDLELLKRAVSSIISAADEKVLTPEEADAVIHFIAERFASRRLDEVIAKVTSPGSGSWFALHGQIEADE